MKWGRIASRLSVGLRALVASRSRRGWLLQVVPLGLLVSLLVATGPYLQDHVFAVVSSDAPSIYGAVYDEAVIQFPSLGEWLSVAFHPYYLVIGLLTAHLSLKRQRLWSVMAAFACWSAFLLTLLDVGAAMLREEATPPMAVNLVANGLGGALIGIIVGFALLLFQRLPRAFPEATVAAPLAASVATVVLGLGLSATLYFALYFLFQPVAVKTSAIFELPIRGSAIQDTDQQAEALNFIPDEPTGGELSFTSPGEQARLAWAASSQVKGYTVTASLLANCWNLDLSKVKAALPLAVWTNVRAVALSYDPGAAMLQTWTRDDARYWFERRAASFFWLGRADKGGLEGTYFVDTGDRLAATTSGEVRVLFGALLLRTRAGQADFEPRRLTLVIDGQPVRLTLHYQQQPGRGRACFPVQVPGQGQSAVAVPSPQVSLLLTLSPPASETGAYVREASRLSISRGNGWLRMSPLLERELADSDLGHSRMLSVAGKALALEADGKKLEVNDLDRFTFIGDLKAGVHGAGRVKVSGEASVLWRNETRVSPTKWERLPGELKLAIASAFVGALGLLMRAVWWPAIRDARDRDVNEWV